MWQFARLAGQVSLISVYAQARAFEQSLAKSIEMEMSDQSSLLQIQTGLFAALVGVLAAKGAASRQEFAEALEILARHEQDRGVAGYFQHMSEELRGVGQKERPYLKLIVGGLDSDAPAISA